ncbi:MAG: MotE family protein [Myxococcota bacterium]
MMSRYLPAVVFVTCVLIGFGVGLEADGQSRTTPDWTTPGWSLPWGMSWPEPPPVVEAESASGDIVADEDGVVADVLSSDPSTGVDVGPSATATSEAAPGSSSGPGVFPGLVNPPAGPESPAAEGDSEAAAGSEAAVDPEAGADAPAVGGKELTAQLAQLQILEEQLKVMSTASQTARQAMEAALQGAEPAPAEEEVQASPEQIEASLVLLTDMVKKMKPAKAAELLAQWEEALAIGILRRLGSRRATPILSKMPIALSGRLTSRIAVGVGALLPVSAEGAQTSPQGEVQ